MLCKKWFWQPNSEGWNDTIPSLALPSVFGQRARAEADHVVFRAHEIKEHLLRGAVGSGEGDVVTIEIIAHGVIRIGARGNITAAGAGIGITLHCTIGGEIVIAPSDDRSRAGATAAHAREFPVTAT